MARESAESIRVGLEQAVKQANDLLNVANKLTDEFKKIGGEVQKSFKSLDLNSSKGISELNTKLKESEDIAKKRTETDKEVVRITKEKIALEKQLKAATDEEVKGRLRMQQIQQEQKNILKDELVLMNQESGTLQKLAAENRKLRREREKLNLDTDKGAKRLKEINAQLDKNNKRIKDNSDAMKQQRLNVGNYTESIKEAANASGLFGGVLGTLGRIQGTLTALLKLNTAEQAENTVAKEANAAATVQLTLAQKALTIATNSGAKALRVFKIALASTGIGALLIAIGSLIAFFTRAQDGADKLSTAFAGVKAAVDVLIDRFELVGRGITQIFEGISQLDGTKIRQGIETLGGAFEDLGNEIENDVKLATDLKRLTIELTRLQKLFTAEQAKELTVIGQLTVIAKDKLANDQERLAAVQKINEIEIALSEKQLALQEQELAAALDAISADRTKLELNAEQITFIERIKNGQISAAEAVKQAADFTLSSAAGEEALFNIIEKIVAQEQARQSLLDKQATTARRTASITQEIANKNSKALIQEAKFKREIFADEEESNDNRIKAVQEARDLEIQAAQERLDANLITEREFQFFRLTLFKKTQAEIDALLAPKKSEQKEDPSVKAAKEKAKTINDIEQAQYEGQINRLEKLAEAEVEGSEQQQEYLRQANELRRNKLIAQAEFEISLEGKTAEEIELIRQELQNDLDQIDDNGTKDLQTTLDKRKQLYEQSVESVSKLFSDFYSKQQDEMDRNLAATLDAQSRIQQGIEAGNEDARRSLAAEERQQAELERKKEQTRKKAQRAEAAIALLRVLGENADQPNALGKTLSDYGAILAAIQAAPSFYHGTDKTDDKVIFPDKYGGVTGFVHKDEMVFSQKDRADVGFRTRDQIKEIVATHERNLIHEARPHILSIDNTEIIVGLQSVKKSLDSLPSKMPVSDYKFDEVGKQHVNTVRYYNRVETLRKRANQSWA